MNYRKLLTALIAMAAVSFSQSISLSGTVLDDSTNLPIDGASVSLMSHGISDWTDSEGRFSIEYDFTAETVVNGHFSDGSETWTLNTWGGEGSGSVVSGEYNISVTSVGENAYEIQLIQPGINLVQGRTYKLSFEAYAQSERTLEVTVGQHESPWDKYIDEPLIASLSTTKKSFDIEFEMNDPTDANTRIEFNAGDQLGEVFIDNVSLKGVDPTGINKKRSSLSMSLNSPTVLRDGSIRFSLDADARVSIRTYSLQGQLVASSRNHLQAGSHSLHSPIRASGTFLHRISIGPNTHTIKQTNIGGENVLFAQTYGSTKSLNNGASSFAKKVAEGFVDTLSVSASGYMRKKVEVVSPDASDIVIELMKDTSTYSTEKTRHIVMPDWQADPDDEQSMVRFLVHSNRFDVEGIIVATGCWRKNQYSTDYTEPFLNAYAQVYDNLTVHAEGYPTPEHLRSVSKQGQKGYGMGDVGQGKDSPGSELIIAAVDKDDPRPVWIGGWGGTNTLAQAVWKVRETRSAAELEQFLSKIRVYDILGQCNSGTWLAKNFPDLFYIRATGVYGWQPSDGWLATHVQSHGPMGNVYPDRKYATEGDTPAFMHAYPNGLNDPEQIHHGGWGGRFDREKKRGIRGMQCMSGEDAQYDPYYMYGNSSDGANAIKRWSSGYDNEFQARMDWTITSNYSEANHNPIAVVNGDKTKRVLEVSAQAGSSVTLDAAGSSDPDGNSLKYNWFVYGDPGTYSGSVNIQGSSSESATVQVPSNAGGKDFHVILELTDNGTPSLYAYRRVIINVQ